MLKKNTVFISYVRIIFIIIIIYMFISIINHLIKRLTSYPPPVHRGRCDVKVTSAVQRAGRSLYL